jgi:hypothetical protein
VGDAGEDSGVTTQLSAVDWRWGEVDAARVGDDVHLIHRHVGARLTVRAGRLIRGEGYAQASAEARRDLARVGAIVRLRQRGRYLVHAAGAVDPQGRAWLLAGDSGCGKSTLGYALIRAGWTSLGDDGVVIEATSGGLHAHAWRDPLKVSALLASEFPELRADAPRARRGDPRRRVSLSVPAGPMRARLAAVVFLARSERFSMTRLGAVAALGALVRQSPWVILEDAASRDHLDVLRRVASLKVFHLEHTHEELHTIASVLARAIA